MVSPDKPQKPIETPEVLHERLISGRSLNVMLSKIDELMQRSPNQVVDYTLADLRSEHTIGVIADLDDLTVVGKRWKTEVSRDDGLNIACEVTTYDETAQKVLTDAELKKGRLAATVWFMEHLGTQPNDSSFSLLTSIFRGGPEKHTFGRSEINGDISLTEGLSEKDEVILEEGAKIVGAQMVFAEYAPEARGETRHFFIDVHQALGTDMVKAAGKLATLPVIE